MEDTFELKGKVDDAVAALEQARQKAEQTQAKIDALKDSYQRGVITGQEFAAQVAALNAQLGAEASAVGKAEREVGKLEAAYDRAARAAQRAAERQEAAAQRAFNAAAKQAGVQSPITGQAGAAGQGFARRLEADAAGAASGTSRLHNELFKVAFLLDDLQYVGEQGLRPILNNLVLLNPALGVVAIGLNLLYDHWGQLRTLAEGTDFAKPMDDLSASLKQVGQGLGFVSGEFDKMVAAGKAANAELAKIKGADEQARQRSFTTAVEQQGGGAAVAAQAVAEYRRTHPQLDAQAFQLQQAKIERQVLGATQGKEADIGAVLPLLPREFRDRFEQGLPGSQERVKELEAENKAVADAARARNEAIDDANTEATKAHQAWLKGRVDETVKALDKEAKAAAGGGIGAEFIKRKLLGTGQYTDAGAAEVARGANAVLGEQAAARARVEALRGPLQAPEVKAEFLGATDIIHRAQSAALSGKDRTGEMTVDELKKVNRNLERLRDREDAAAAIFGD